MESLTGLVSWMMLVCFSPRANWWSIIASFNTMCTNVGREEVTSMSKCMLTQFDGDSYDMFYDMPQMNVVWHELSDYDGT